MTANDADVRAAFLQALSDAQAKLSRLLPGEEAANVVMQLRGAASMVAETELAAALWRAARHVRSDAQRLAKVVELLAAAQLRYARGEPALRSTWPVPPEDLDATGALPNVRDEFLRGVKDRLCRMDRALADGRSAREALSEVLREVHGLKGAALAAEADAMAWYCHGLETALRADLSRDDSEGEAKALRRVANARQIIAELAEDPALALRRLASSGAPQSAPPSTGRIALRRTTGPRAADTDEARVSQATLDALVSDVSEANHLAHTLTRALNEPSTHAQALERIISTLAEGRRLLGPARPWGPPNAALSRLEAAQTALERLLRHGEREHEAARAFVERLMSKTHEAMHRALDLRTVRLAQLFDRARAALEAQARLAGRNVTLLVTGGGLEVDRPLAEKLFDPIVQVLSNAVAHGIEPEHERIQQGKPKVGTIALTAERSRLGLRIKISDDGRGVDVHALRRLVAERKLIAENALALATDEMLLEMLFLPGVTTRTSADVLSGRGMGLDLAAACVRRLGGTVRFSSEPGSGATVTFDIPMHAGPVHVLWVSAGSMHVALIASDVNNAQLGGDAPALDALLTGRKAQARPWVLWLDALVDDGQRLRVSVDRIGRLEPAVPMPIPSLLRTFFPFRGAIARDDGALGWLIDTEALARVS